MIQQQRHIDLTVPTGWNQCTTRQLEQVAQILLRRMAMQDRYHPYDPVQFKAECFFALAGLTVVAQAGDETFTVRRGKEEPFEMAVWQVHSFVDQHLKWLDTFDELQLFPYPSLGHYWAWRWVVVPWRYRLAVDGELLDGMTWRHYRLAQEWLTYYVDSQDADARTAFLCAVYRLPDGHKPRALRRLRADRFQLILIWWQSMMKEMQRKYSRCFKKGTTGNRQQNLPIDLYTRSTATLQKYLAQTEDEINNQPCRVILQHLEDMAREAEELEKINRKHK